MRLFPPLAYLFVVLQPAFATTPTPAPSPTPSPSCTSFYNMSGIEDSTRRACDEGGVWKCTVRCAHSLEWGHWATGIYFENISKDATLAQAIEACQSILAHSAPYTCQGRCAIGYLGVIGSGWACGPYTGAYTGSPSQTCSGGACPTPSPDH